MDEVQQDYEQQVNAELREWMQTPEHQAEWRSYLATKAPNDCHHVTHQVDRDDVASEAQGILRQALEAEHDGLLVWDQSITDWRTP